MERLNNEQINQVAGGDLATGVSYGGGLVTSVAVGLHAGPVGAVAAAGVYSVVWGITYILAQ